MPQKKSLIPSLLFLVWLIVALPNLCAEAAQKPKTNLPEVAVTREWQDFAPYLQHFMEKIQQKWDELIRRESEPLRPGTEVVAEFMINSDGSLSLPSVEGKPRAYGIVIHAIDEAGAQPAWNEDMKRQLGTKQRLVLTFRYQ